MTFYQRDFQLLTDKGLVAIPMPKKAEFNTYVDGQMVFTIKEAWKGFAAGAVVILRPRRTSRRTRRPPRPSWCSMPGAHNAVDRVSSSKDRFWVIVSCWKT